MRGKQPSPSALGRSLAEPGPCSCPRFALSFVIIFVGYEWRWFFYTFWGPTTWLMGYIDPRKPGGEPLHEWYFRVGLDRYVWIWGMICAYLHPKSEELLQKVGPISFSGHCANYHVTTPPYNRLS